MQGPLRPHRMRGAEVLRPPGRCEGDSSEGGARTTEDGDVYTVVLYARVSTDDKGQTNETQVRELREYCARKGYVIADDGDAVYTDEQTGRNDRRPGFRMLKGRISEGDVDYVLARNQDRISREPKDYQNFLDYCRQFRVRVRFSDNDAKPETADGVLFDSLQAGLAKADNIKRSMGTKKGMATAKLNGVHCGRMRAIVFTDDVEAERAKIMTRDTAKKRTVVVSVDTVLDLARQGLSIGKAASILGIGKTTLYDALVRKGIEREFLELASQSVRKGKCSEREGEDLGNRSEREVARPVRKGNPCRTEPTLRERFAGGRSFRSGFETS